MAASMIGVRAGISLTVARRIVMRMARPGPLYPRLSARREPFPELLDTTGDVAAVSGEAEPDELPAVDGVEVDARRDSDAGLVEQPRGPRHRVVGPARHVRVDVERPVGRCEFVEADLGQPAQQ